MLPGGPPCMEDARLMLTTAPPAHWIPPQAKEQGSPVPQLFSTELPHTRMLSRHCSSSLPCGEGSGILPGSQKGSGG